MPPARALDSEFESVAGSLSRIESEAVLPVGALQWVNAGAGGSGNATMVGGISYAGSTALPPAYPKGFGAHYCMKYELNQGQYTDFLNCLSRTQQVRQVPADISADSPAGVNTYVMVPNGLLSWNPVCR